MSLLLLLLISSPSLTKPGTYVEEHGPIRAYLICRRGMCFPLISSSWLFHYTFQRQILNMFLKTEKISLFSVKMKHRQPVEESTMSYSSVWALGFGSLPRYCEAKQGSWTSVWGGKEGACRNRYGAGTWGVLGLHGFCSWSVLGNPLTQW